MAFTPRSLPFFAASLILAASSVARAQGFDAERFTPAAGAESDLAVESPVTPLHLGVGLGLFLNYADDPLVVTDTATGDVVSRPIDSALTADLIASIGLFDRFELGAQIPVHIIYDGDSTASEGAGDLHLVPKLTLLGAGDVDSHFVLGLGVPVTLPTGDEDELRGAGGFSIEPRLLALWRMGRLGIMANLGYRYRHEKPAGLPVGDEITTAASVDFDLVPDTLALHGEVFGGFEVNTDESDGPHVPLEALAGIRWQAAPSLRVYAVAGPGLAHGLGAPDFRAVAGIRFSSRSPSEDGFGDQDGDGFADRDDDCPTDPEDADAFADDDGCPEADNDQDGILDNDDQCPDL
ncbi:MAG TPA: transporter, partial [Kofleriaceae bacterium]|nr:transporter [Kofleriaceae bacterium]